MTKFETMITILFSIHLFLEVALIGTLAKIEAAIMSKSTWEERQR